jgi:hypothetical protein
LLTIANGRRTAGGLTEADSPLREQFEVLARQYDQLADSLEGMTSKKRSRAKSARRHVARAVTGGCTPI